MIYKTMPASDGFRMPAEYERHAATILIWPVRPGSWPYGGRDAKPVFSRIARELATGEKVYILAGEEHIDEAREEFRNDENISVIDIATDDAWARDVGPTFVVNDEGCIRGIDWQFNAWGGEVDGLYANWERDNACASKFCEKLGYDCYDAQDFVLEGGSIHSDGEGTLIVTEACLLSAGRNPHMSKAQIEERLKAMLGAKKVIWLPRGIAGDETNEHVDNMCAFVGPAEVVLAWTDDEGDEQYRPSLAALEALEGTLDAKGRQITVHKLNIPGRPVRIAQEDLDGFVFEEGEDVREAGERLAASYANFYIGNSVVLVPQFGDVNDTAAVETLKKCFPTRRVVGIYARAIIVGGGNIHCITQQIPDGGRS
ncbi:MAG: agmatine deiminase [Lachnospiraceae bacterium]|nr:agmatine deiminase [Lachnospiraceae bacterium]